MDKFLLPAPDSNHPKLTAIVRWQILEGINLPRPVRGYFEPTGELDWKVRQLLRELPPGPGPDRELVERCRAELVAWRDGATHAETEWVEGGVLQVVRKEPRAREEAGSVVDGMPPQRSKRKFPWADVCEMRRLHQEGATIASLSRRFDLGPEKVVGIVKYRTRLSE